MTSDTDAAILEGEASAAAERVVRTLSNAGLTLAVAESCTGGLVGHLITDVAGSSRCFLGAVVPYDNDAKERIAGVPKATMVEHGAVSAETALAMAQGVRERFRSDIGLAVTGIAGPGGGTAAKPVGLVHIALVAADGRTLTYREVWDGDRRANKRRSALAGLTLIEGFLTQAKQGCN